MSEQETRGIIAASEDGDWYALDGGLTRDEAIAALLHIGVELAPTSGDLFALALGRGHIARMTKREREAEGWDRSEYDEFWHEVRPDHRKARAVWIAS